MSKVTKEQFSKWLDENNVEILASHYVKFTEDGPVANILWLKRNDDFNIFIVREWDYEHTINDIIQTFRTW